MRNRGWWMWILEWRVLVDISRIPATQDSMGSDPLDALARQPEGAVRMKPDIETISDAIYWGGRLDGRDNSCDPSDPAQWTNAIEALKRLECQLEAQAKEIEVLRVNDRRYRWLREKSKLHASYSPSASMLNGAGIKVIWQNYGTDPRVQPMVFLNDEHLDNTIDAALGQSVERK